MSVLTPSLPLEPPDGEEGSTIHQYERAPAMWKAERGKGAAVGGPVLKKTGLVSSTNGFYQITRQLDKHTKLFFARKALQYHFGQVSF